jgi:hypothetical protein
VVNSGTPVTVEFDAKAAAFLRSVDHKVDLDSARLVSPDGTARSLDSRVSPEPSNAERYAVVSGEKLAEAEPWTFRLPGMPGGVFGKPQAVRFVGRETGLGVEFLDADGKPVSARTSDDFQGFRTDTKVLRRDRYATLDKIFPEVTSEQNEGAEFLREEPFPGIRFQAPSKQTMEIAMASFQTVLGKSAAERAETVDLAKLESFEKVFQGVLEAEKQQSEEVDGFAALNRAAGVPAGAEALEAILGPGAEGLGSGQLLQAVRDKLLRACPLEIVVVPKGKTAADCVEPHLAERLQGAGRAYFFTMDPLAHRAQTGSKDLPAQRLFIGEEVLEDETAVKVVLMHELLHVFEHRYATTEEQQQIQTSFAEAKEFQSLYGSSPFEYLPTVAEEFLGAHGPEGPDWVKKHHPKVHQLLSRLMGGEKESEEVGFILA